MIHYYTHGSAPRYSDSTNHSDAVDAKVSCESPLYTETVDASGTVTGWAETGTCDFSGTVPVWSDGSTPVWECPRCANEHRERVTA